MHNFSEAQYEIFSNFNLLEKLCDSARLSFMAANSPPAPG